MFGTLPARQGYTDPDLYESAGLAVCETAGRVRSNLDTPRTPRAKLADSLADRYRKNEQTIDAYNLAVTAEIDVELRKVGSSVDLVVATLRGMQTGYLQGFYLALGVEPLLIAHDDQENLIRYYFTLIDAEPES